MCYNALEETAHNRMPLGMLQGAKETRCSTNSVRCAGKTVASAQARSSAMEEAADAWLVLVATQPSMNATQRESEEG